MENGHPRPLRWRTPWDNGRPRPLIRRKRPPLGLGRKTKDERQRPRTLNFGQSKLRRTDTPVRSWTRCPSPRRVTRDSEIPSADGLKIFDRPCTGDSSAVFGSRRKSAQTVRIVQGVVSRFLSRNVSFPNRFTYLSFSVCFRGRKEIEVATFMRDRPRKGTELKMVLEVVGEMRRPGEENRINTTHRDVNDLRGF